MVVDAVVCIHKTHRKLTLRNECLSLVDTNTYRLLTVAQRNNDNKIKVGGLLLSAST